MSADDSIVCKDCKTVHSETRLYLRELHNAWEVESQNCWEGSEKGAKAGQSLQGCISFSTH